MQQLFAHKGTAAAQNMNSTSTKHEGFRIVWKITTNFDTSTQFDEPEIERQTFFQFTDGPGNFPENGSAHPDSASPVCID